MTQLEFEKLMLDMGVEHETDAPYGRQLLKEIIHPVASALRAHADRPRGRGKPLVADKYFQIFSAKENPTAQGRSEVFAFILGKLVIERMSKRRLLSAVAIAVGEAFEAEATGVPRFALKKRLRSSDAAWKAKQEHCHTGMKFLDIFIETTGLVECTLDRRGKRTQWVLHLSSAGAQWIADSHSKNAFLTPIWLPMIEPPRPWNERGEGGGYHTFDRSLLKRSWKLARFRGSAPTVAGMAAAVNLVQQTAWRINGRVLKVMQELFKKGVGVGTIPSRPEKKRGPLSPKARKQNAKYEMDGLTLEARKQNAKYEMVRLTLEAAQLCESYPRIYFPHQLDWRGRFYPMPSYLNPQGSDYARALLMFADGQPILDQAAANWLAIHGANCFGKGKVDEDDGLYRVDVNYDVGKATFEDRLWWTFWSEEDILKSADDQCPSTISPMPRGENEIGMTVAYRQRSQTCVTIPSVRSTSTLARLGTGGG